MSENMPARPDTIIHEIMGLTQPSQQHNWTDDDEWLEFGGCDAITRDHNFHAVGGMMWGRDEDQDDDNPPEVLLAWMNLSNGDTGKIEMEPDDARRLAAALLVAADAAETEKYGQRLSTFEIMEKRRAAWHRKEARAEKAARRRRERKAT